MNKEHNFAFRRHLASRILTLLFLWFKFTESSTVPPRPDTLIETLYLRMRLLFPCFSGLMRGFSSLNIMQICAVFFPKKLQVFKSLLFSLSRELFPNSVQFFQEFRFFKYRFSHFEYQQRACFSAHFSAFLSSSLSLYGSLITRSSTLSGSLCNGSMMTHLSPPCRKIMLSLIKG